MDKRRNDSYEETHRRLVEAMQEACIHDDFADYPEPDIDISFIYDDVEDDFEEIPAGEAPKKKRFTFSSRFNKVAAILIILLLSGNLLMLATESGDSYGEKGLLHRIKYNMSSLFTDEETVLDNEIINTYVATDLKSVNKIRKMYPKLYVPTYLPYNMEFEQLLVELYKSGDCWCEYIYKYNDEKVVIGITYVQDSLESVYANKASEKEEIKLNDRYVYIYKDIDPAYYVADIYFEDSIVDITGLSNKDELIQIAKNLRKNENAH